MKIVDVVPKDVHILFELSISEINNLTLALSLSKIICTNGEEETSSRILRNFFNMLSEISTSLKGKDEQD